ncbi:hypothetical protein FIBSPDRAFT_849068 [Athelia psychrophila]|uniref:Uncharacterized protein n=1 Tax=Athelia psychrophila TaxID=1759441 RepID=A0A166UW15_9AGAM|nr:hypothetical protein FIBSPDRAFT_849068 [Fibularhizoctonia sp. CBS 109695]
MGMGGGWRWEARADHSVAAAAAFADKEAAVALAKNQAAQWAALRFTEAKAAHLAVIEAPETTLARVQRWVGMKYWSAGKWVEGRSGYMQGSRLGAQRMPSSCHHAMGVFAQQ